MPVTSSTPGTAREIKGSLIYLAVKHEWKGDPERQEFHVKEFRQSTGILQVELWSKKDEKLFKSTISNPEEVVSDHKICLDVISHTLQQILWNKADNVTTSVKVKNGKSVLEIKAAVESKIFDKIVVYDFVYKFPFVKISDHERMEIKLLEIWNKVAELELVEGGIKLRTIEERLKEIEDFCLPCRLFPGKVKVEARFNVSFNNYNSVTNKCITIERYYGQNVWETTPVDFEMKNGGSYRARFRVESWYTNIMFGVISSSFTNYQSYPGGNGQHGWVAYFCSGKLHTSYQQNGSFQIYSNGPAPLKGCIVAVELFTKEGYIQYFVNGVAAGLHKGCTFGDPNRFAVVLYQLKDKVTLLSLERLQDDF